MRVDIDGISSTQELADIYVQVHNKFWFMEDDLYDYEEGSDVYNKIRDNIDAWAEIMDLLDSRIMKSAQQENLLAERRPESGTVKQFEVFMKKYGYRNGCGWWVKLE